MKPPAEPADAAPPVPPPRSRSRVARLAWAGLGWVFFALGVAGIVLPIVPATPFMLLALWAFSQSSARLEAWLLGHPRFGAPLRRWRAHRVVPWSAKLIAWTSMAASLTWMIVSGRVPWPGIAVTAAIMAYGVWFLARCPSYPPPPPA